MKFTITPYHLTCALLVAASHVALANPTGLTVVSGSATAQHNGAQLNISTSQAAFLNWSSFNIAAGETTTFLQPSANSVVLNVIGGASPSQIYGSLTANGTVILANANGFYFGPNSMIKVGGSFIATTAPLLPDFGAGGSWQFTGMPPTASIVNYGQIQAGGGKSLFLIAEQIDNHGGLSAPGGDVGLYAGKEVLVSERPDGRGLSATVQLPSGSVNNFGQITADAGTIALQAQVVNQNGIIQADSIQNRNGEIELVASDSLNLGASSIISANGDNSPDGSSGGTITLKSGNIFGDSAGSRIAAAGGEQGGHGGTVEISAPNIQSLESAVNTGAHNGAAGGDFLLDPANIILGTSGNGAVPGNGTVNSGSNSGTDAYGDLFLNVNTAFKNITAGQILLQATGNIYVGNGTVNGSGVFSFAATPAVTWDLSSSTGKTGGQVTLQAGQNITFGNGSKIFDAHNWSLTLQAGYDFANNVVQPGGGTTSGNIFLNGGSGLAGNGSIQLSAGSINLFAGQNILLASQSSHQNKKVSGSVFTTGGGSIFAQALAGNIDAGTSNGANNSGTQTSDYTFNNSGATPSTTLGGFSTKAGGNVTLIAGNNIDSTPVVPSGKWPGASGTFGSGDVTIIAGNQINGNFNLANGQGTMIAGVQLQSGQAAVLQNPALNPAAYAATLNALAAAATQSQNPNGNIGGVEYPGQSPSAVSLSLIQGTWNVWAVNNIFLKEVNNPNGTFNSLQSYLYNYSAGAAANFWAGNAIELAGGTTGGNLARVPGGNQGIVYAPGLSLNAGAGGILIDAPIILAPSSAGSLQIVTRDGGDLAGAVTAGATSLIGISMSDSGSTDYNSFGSGHAATPLHLNDPNPVKLEISGDINSFELTVPTFAQINVVGNTYNFGFVGQNLQAGEVTSINVGQTARKNMENGGWLNPATDASLVVGGDISYRGDLTTELLAITGAGGNPDPISSSLFATVIGGDPALSGKLQYDAGTGILTYVGVLSSSDDSFLKNPTDANGKPVAFDAYQLAGWQTAIAKLFNDSSTASIGDQGLALTGPGSFNITAKNIDLGISGGIAVLAPDTALAAISPYGANLNVTTSGDLRLTATKIANESYLGGININVGGILDVGGEFTPFGDPSSPKGIFTTSGGNISLAAGGDVNVNGSRIAAYDGGNLEIQSLNGDVNAGTGGAGYVTMNSLELNSAGQLTGIAATIPGSGILATTVVGSDATLGNISINAPKGSVNASLGGILQIAFNGREENSLLEINAGKDINAQGSGIIGSNIKLQAGGDINGLVIGRKSVDIPSAQNVNVTVFSGGDVNIKASGEIAGTIISGGNVDASGESITASLIASSVATSGDASGATEGIPQSNAPKENAENADDASTIAAKSGADEDELNRKKKGIALAQKVSRVTVLLPGKKPN